MRLFQMFLSFTLRINKSKMNLSPRSAKMKQLFFTNGQASSVLAFTKQKELTPH